MESARGQSGADALIKKLHERPHIPLADSLRAPAHVHYKAFRMADRRTERRAGRSFNPALRRSASRRMRPCYTRRSGTESNKPATANG
jgi:hypothetical protein